MLIIDKLIDSIIKLKNPSTIGLDTQLSYLPQELTEGIDSLEGAAKSIFEFNKNIIDSICDIVPSVKVQVACYEMYGSTGLAVFEKTVSYARSKGLIAISDVKRNDIGSTASCYSGAYLGGVNVGGKTFTAFDTDFITVNGYLGSDGIKPFTDDCKKHGKGLFILVKTSNPASSELQDRVFEGGKTLYETMGEYVRQWGDGLIGKHGYSSVGAVVGATHAAQAKKLRENLGSVFFLIPGYGAQGGTAQDLSVCFDKNGLGGIVNSSRAILNAYKTDKYKGKTYFEAARLAAIDMKNDLSQAINIKSR